MTREPTPAVLPASEPPGQSIRTSHSLIVRALFGIVVLTGIVTGSALLLHHALEGERPIESAEALERPMTIADVRTWAIQLHNLDLRTAAQAPFDLLVVDPDQLATARAKPLADTVEALKRRPGGKRRLVFGYVSIGEAESGRSYWSDRWVVPASPDGQTKSSEGDRKAGTDGAERRAHRHQRQPSAAAPDWLLGESRETPGKFVVRYWDRDWQGLIFGSARAMVDQIVAAGFDGLWLDGAEVATRFRQDRPTAATDMADFVIALAEHARALNPNLLIVMQNAEELLSHVRLRKTLDAIAKENLLFGISDPGSMNPHADIASSLHYLQRFKNDGRPVFVLEYLTDAQRAAQARERIRAYGFLPYIASRDLGRLVPQP